MSALLALCVGHSQLTNSIPAQVINEENVHVME